VIVDKNRNKTGALTYRSTLLRKLGAQGAASPFAAGARDPVPAMRFEV
jgi:hypothetical protein